MTTTPTVAVPVEPTEAMIAAGERAAWGDNNSMPAIRAMSKAWSAMLAAAPALTAQAGEGEEWPEELTPEMEQVWRSAFISQGHLRRNHAGLLKHPDSCERAAYRALRKFAAKSALTARHEAPASSAGEALLRQWVDAFEGLGSGSGPLINSTRAYLDRARSPQVEAVAWILDHPFHGKGLSFVRLADADRREGFTEEALYTHPQPAQTPGVGGEADALRTLLDNVVISQSLSRDLREKAVNEARSYLYDLRHGALTATQPDRAAKPADGGLREALTLALAHIDHMAAWISKTNMSDVALHGYSFEGLGEDRGVMRAALAAGESA